MSASPENVSQGELMALVPNLRAFARSLSGSPDKADDLVQETLIKAWKNRDSFAKGSNLKAWLFTILRNTFLSERRKARYEVEDADGAYAAQVSSPGEQMGHMDLADFREALDKLPTEQREAIILIGAEGFSYEEAALTCGCAIGTMKSRVNRARNRLIELMGIAGVDDFGPDHHIGLANPQGQAQI